jgi:hypothetical protein
MNLTVTQAAERSSPVILSEAKDLAASRDRPFASLRVTRCDCSNGQEHFVQIEPCLTIEKFSTNNQGEPGIISNHSLCFFAQLYPQITNDWIIERDMKNRQHEVEERDEVELLPGEIATYLALQEWRK